LLLRRTSRIVGSQAVCDEGQAHSKKLRREAAERNRSAIWRPIRKSAREPSTLKKHP
jgi:hypothetical protein